MGDNGKIILISVLSILLLMTRSNSISKEVNSSMVMVLSSPQAVYLADWTEENLKSEKVITDFAHTVRISGIGVSAVDQVIGVVGFTSENDKNKVAVFFVDPSTGGYRKVFEDSEVVHSILSIAIAPNKQAIAFTSTMPSNSRDDEAVSGPPGVHQDMYIYNLKNDEIGLVLRGKAYNTLSWRADAQEITYDTWEGWIESLSLKSGKVQRLFKGETPVWSPDGRRLAYRSGDEILSYEPLGKIVKQVQKRYFWQRRLVGPLFWSPDGRYLSFNVEGWSLFTGSFLSCVLVEVDSQRTFNVNTHGLQCGPWLAQGGHKIELKTGA